MASEESDERERVATSLRQLIQWRDRIAEEVAKLDAAIAVEARVFATLNGDFVRPTLDQLRKMLFENGKAKP